MSRHALSRLHPTRDAEELERVRQFGSVVVHDLNNAIFALLGRVQLLKRQVTDPAVVKSVAEILETVRLLESLVGSLSGACQREEAAFAVVDARRAIGTALSEALGADAADDGRPGLNDIVATVIDRIPAGAVFEGSTAELSSAMRQLLRLHRRRTERPLRVTAAISGSGEAPRVQILISDDAGEWNHPCTPPSILKGTCDLETLPLAAAQRALRDMGGKAAIEPTAGGLRSWIELPVVLAVSSIEAAAPERAPTGCRGVAASPSACATDCQTACVEARRARHILVADDDPAVRAILVAALESVGDEVDTIAQPSALLEHPQLDLFDVVILDAGGGGLEALQRLRARGSALPVLVASGESLDEKAVANGHPATRVMMKPIPLDQLDRTLTALMS